MCLCYYLTFSCLQVGVLKFLKKDIAFSQVVLIPFHLCDELCSMQTDCMMLFYMHFFTY